MLVGVKAPKPIHKGLVWEGMMHGKVDVTPGTPPPFLVPHCRQCGVMVERFTIDWIASPHYVPIQFQCHGRTSGMKVSYTEVMRAAREGGLLWVFTETVTNGNHRTARPR